MIRAACSGPRSGQFLGDRGNLRNSVYGVCLPKVGNYDSLLAVVEMALFRVYSCMQILIIVGKDVISDYSNRSSRAFPSPKPHITYYYATLAGPIGALNFPVSVKKAISRT